ncbi:dipeptide/oligopeptide/nickel transport system ATP-binding protein [Thermodesulfobium acidiphilum]|uniref:Dipeptide/oligopeptide/nickel transport system ATP-binding protein n=1 Tax=Thermodesulfobium acidiphilum TaxID=1794699 RepID=A0A2R4W048_THEAF|nr:ABC transporter ATP-binding protein [Thermodesulfobium acidiphilum]AWB10179.1 dipeptide/oligopeptide/nickel transport system ATP-binding protein [Thermodesulfobium acidiphilum]
MSLGIYSEKKKRWSKVLNNVNFSLNQNEFLGVVGESGSGKTILANSILKLMPKNSKLFSGSILFNDKNILKLSENQVREIRGRDISIIFQDPMSSLHPLLTVKEQITEILLAHGIYKRSKAVEVALNLLKDVKIDQPELVLSKYPFMLSGGIRQRVMIAIAISCNPKVVIADEPTTALDVTVQKDILDLIKAFKKRLNFSLILISHDLGVIWENTDRVVVMYCGRIVESGKTKDVLRNPLHPYTFGLLSSMPRRINNKLEIVKGIKGSILSLDEFPNDTCPFLPRCDFATKRCNEPISLEPVDNDRFVACFNKAAFK